MPCEPGRCLRRTRLRSVSLSLDKIGELALELERRRDEILDSDIRVAPFFRQHGNAARIAETANCPRPIARSSPRPGSGGFGRWRIDRHVCKIPALFARSSPAP